VTLAALIAGVLVAPTAQAVDPPQFYQIPAGQFGSVYDAFDDDPRVESVTDQGDGTWLVGVVDQSHIAALKADYYDYPWATYEVVDDATQRAETWDGDEAPWNPGLEIRIFQNPGNDVYGCTGAWGWKKSGSSVNYLTTAGHCATRGLPTDSVVKSGHNSDPYKIGDWNGPEFSTVLSNGDSAYYATSPHYRGDLSLFYVSNGQMADKAWYSSTSGGLKIPIGTPVDPDSSTNLCFFGQASHVMDCGFFMDRENNHSYDGLSGVSRMKKNTSTCYMTDGDSGGLVFTRVIENGQLVRIRPVGVLSGSDNPCLGYEHIMFTTVQMLDKAWAGQVIN
jgi:hypothetical protein